MHKDHKRTLNRLGANIRNARVDARLSLDTLSKLSGVSKGGLSKIENGTGNATVITLYKLCWSLGVHPRDVLPGFD